MSEPALEPASVGKQLDVGAAGDTTGTPDNRDPFDRAKVDALLADPEALAGKSETEIAAMMGVGEYDRSVTAGPDGDATMHELQRRADAAPPVAAAAPAAAAPAKVEPAAPAVAPAAAAATPAADAAALAAVAAATTGATPDPVIATKDGRPIISYGVLQAERRENARLRDELAKAKAAPAPGAAPAVATPTEEPSSPAIEITAEDLALYTEDEVTALREKYPEELVNRMVRDNKVAVAAYTNQQNDVAQRQLDAQRTAQMSVVDFTDQHPVLSVWAAGATPADKGMFEAAVVQDRVLRDLPEWADRPWQERMEQAVKNTALIHGIAYGSPAPTPAPGTTQPSLADRANAALAAAAANPKLPTSHSDLPAGTPAGTREVDVVAGMSPTQLEAKLLAMTPDAAEKWLASMG